MMQAESFLCVSIINMVFGHVLVKKTAFLLLLPSPWQGDAISKLSNCEWARGKENVLSMSQFRGSNSLCVASSKP